MLNKGKPRIDILPQEINKILLKKCPSIFEFVVGLVY
jgi:hypothetical protein